MEQTLAFAVNLSDYCRSRLTRVDGNWHELVMALPGLSHL